MQASLLAICTVAFIVPACATMGDVKLTEPGSHIVASPNPPSSDCENKGTVIGETSGSSVTSAGEHTRRAVDDARNKAAGLGANYLQTTAPQLAQGEYGPTGATVMATAFLCKQPVGEPAAQQPAAQQPAAQQPARPPGPTQTQPTQPAAAPPAPGM